MKPFLFLLLALLSASIALMLLSTAIKNLRVILDVFIMSCFAAIGVKLPDIDLLIPFLGHRSALTHCAALPFCVYLLGWKRAGIGLAYGVTVHLVADFFPNSWIGFSLITIPGIGRLPLLISIAWIGINAIVAAYIWFSMAACRPALQQILIIIAFCFMTFYYFRLERKPILWIPLIITILIAITIASKRSEPAENDSYAASE